MRLKILEVSPTELPGTTMAERKESGFQPHWTTEADEDTNNKAKVHWEGRILQSKHTATEGPAAKGCATVRNGAAASESPGRSDCTAHGLLAEERQNPTCTLKALFWLLDN